MLEVNLYFINFLIWALNKTYLWKWTACLDIWLIFWKISKTCGKSGQVQTVYDLKNIINKWSFIEIWAICTRKSVTNYPKLTDYPVSRTNQKLSTFPRIPQNFPEKLGLFVFLFPENKFGIPGNFPENWIKKLRKKLQTFPGNFLSRDPKGKP